MTFKDCVKRDNENIFLNTAEFADAHTVNGVSMSVLIDSNELIDRQKGNKLIDNNGIYQSETLIYVKASEFGAKPKAGAELDMDGKEYRVTDCGEEDGLYSITIKRNKL